MERLMNVVTVLSIVLFLVVLRSLRRSHIRVEYSVSWLAAAVFLLVLSRAPGPLAWLTRYLGLSEPAVTLIIIVSCMFLAVFYRFSRVISRLKDANIAMAQRVAILECQIEALHEQQTR